jgi:hypothetical protein
MGDLWNTNVDNWETAHTILPFPDHDAVAPTSNEFVPASQVSDLEALIIWTMTYYGSPADEKAVPGSRLRDQANYIATVLQAYENALRWNDSKHVEVRMYWPGRK